MAVFLFVFGIPSSDSIYGQGTTYSTTTFVNLGTPGIGPTGVTLDSAGNLFATNGHAIQKISPSGSVALHAGNVAIAGSASGTGSAAQFNGPTGIAIDESDNLYVADTGNNAIRKIAPSGIVTTLAGFIQGNADGVGIAAQFNRPVALAVGNSGTVHVVDDGNNSLRTVAPDGTTRTILQGASLSFALPVSPLGIPSYKLTGVAIDSEGTLFVAVYVFTPFGAGLFPREEITVLRRTASDTFTPQTSFRLETGSFTSRISPRSSGVIAADASGNIYAIADNALYLLGFGQIAAARVFQAVNGSAGFSAGLVVDPLGRIYISNRTVGTVVLATPLGQPPSITTHPQGATIQLGRSVILSTSIAGSAPFTYQWSLNGTAIAGATAASYPATFAGSYTVIVTNAAGSVTSNPAIVTIANRLANISTRAQVGADSNVEIAGFIISGPIGTTKPVLIRGVGPGLARLSVPGMLPQASLTVFDSRGAAVATNTGWNTNSNAVQIATVAAGVGAFELQLNSADSALLLSLAPGAYTAAVSGVNGSTGVALAEVYEAASDSGQLVNISTRAMVGTGANIAISGIVVQGSQPGRFLIRGLGPALEAFGVTGVLADPLLTLTTVTGAPVATNDNWSENTNASEIAIVGATAGAFPLGSGSRDAVLLVTLAPGSYTALVSGIGNSTGVALVEIYQVQ